MSSLLMFNRVHSLEIQSVMLVFSTPLVYCCPSTFSLTSSLSRSKFNTLFLTRFKTYKLLHHPNKNDHKIRHLGIGVFKFLRPWRQCTDRDKLGDWERRMFTLGGRHTDRLTDRLAKRVRNTGTRNFSLKSKGYIRYFFIAIIRWILICRHRSMLQVKEMFKILLLTDWNWGFCLFLVEPFIYFPSSILPQSFSLMQKTAGGGDSKLPCSISLFCGHEAASTTATASRY